MKVIWKISKSEKLKWKEFYNSYKNREFVIDRKKQIKSGKVDISKNKLWRVHVGCQITTQQRSGVGTAVDAFLKSKNPVLSYKACISSRNTEKFISKEISKSGLRRSNVIANNLVEILQELESGGWDRLTKQLKTISGNTNKNNERLVANYLKNTCKGLGHKQSRNYIQWLGLSRYEIPIDSRTLKIMKKLNCSFTPNSNGLSDEPVYLLVQDGLQLIAKDLNIYPCILDACIFSSFEK